MSATFEPAPAFKDVGNYNYTRPRQPIAAMFSSPGPCYGLPGLVGQQQHDTRSVHRKYPAWNFGIRHGKFRDDCSPGPCYFPDPKIYRFVSRFVRLGFISRSQSSRSLSHCGPSLA